MSIQDQIATIKERLKAAKGTPAAATFQKVLEDLEKKLKESEQSDKEAQTAEKTPSKTENKAAKETKKTKAKKSAPPSEAPESESAPESLEMQSTEASEASEEHQEPEIAPSFFQAIGNIKGLVIKKEDDTGWILKIDQNEYDLVVSKKLRRIIKFVEGQETTLLVYPQVRYEKGDRENCKIYFKLVAWEEDNKVNNPLFQIRGIWQFIPQYKRPVISIYRNQKRSDSDRCKASHIPVLWKDSEIRPFKFNPKIKDKKEQADKYFVEVTAKFIPRLNTFGVVEVIGEPTKKLPRYIRPVKLIPEGEAEQQPPVERKESSNPEAKIKPKKKEKTQESETSEPVLETAET